MQNSDALWYDYETEETALPANRRRGWLSLLALTMGAAAATYVGYGTLIAG